MADEPEDATLRVLIQIQQTLADHGRMLSEHSRNFADLKHQMNTVEESVVTALGFAAHANVRHESVRKQIEALEDRISRLEERV